MSKKKIIFDDEHSWLYGVKPEPSLFGNGSVVIIFSVILIMFFIISEKKVFDVNSLKEKKSLLINQRLRIEHNIDNATIELKKIDSIISDINKKINEERNDE